jgi:hypothetical protein
VRAQAPGQDGADHTPVGEDEPASSVDLYWLPLGAGATVPIVRWNGRLFEAVSARRAGRPAQALFHAALAVRHDAVPVTIEMTPVWGNGRVDRGVVCDGPVGLPWLGRSRLFRYEVRRWRHGVIPDVAYAVGGRQRLSTDEATAGTLLDLVPRFPTATWGRDEFGTGDMWNSNSLVAWLLVRSGIDTGAVAPPGNGRAPGWSAGLAVAAR